MNRGLALLLIGVLVATGMPVDVGAGTTTDTSTTRRYQESFDPFTTGSAPPAIAASWYATATAGTGTADVVESPTCPLTAKCVRVNEAGAPYTFQLHNTAGGVDLCQSTQSVQFDFSVPNDISTADIVEHRVTGVAATSGPLSANFVAIRFTGVLAAGNEVDFVVDGATGTETAGTTSGSGSTTTIVAVGTLLHATISAGNCAGTTCFNFSLTGTTPSLPAVNRCATGGVALTGPLNRLAVAHTAGTAGKTTFLDNYDWQGAPLPPPTVTAVSPTSGSATGGTSVTITGTEFKAGATVTFGGAPATAVVVADPTVITAKTPAGTAGTTVDIVVTNPGGASGTLPASYTYLCPVDPGNEDAVETYEAQPSGSNPVACWYTNASGPTVTLNRAVVGVTPNKVQDWTNWATTTGAVGYYTFTGVTSLCGTTSGAPHRPIEFDFTMTFPATGTGVASFIGFQPTSSLSGQLSSIVGLGTAAFGWSVDKDGTMALIAGARATAGSSTLQTQGFSMSGGPFVRANAHHILLSPDCFNESTGQPQLAVTVTLRDLVTGSLGSSTITCPTSGGCPGAGGFSWNAITFGGTDCSRASGGACPGTSWGASAHFYLDNLMVRGDPTPRTFTVSVPGLIGMDVSPAGGAGGYIIARTSVDGEINGEPTPDSITTFSGANLAGGLTQGAGGCNQQHSVSAGEAAMAYAFCCPDENTYGDAPWGGGICDNAISDYDDFGFNCSDADEGDPCSKGIRIADRNFAKPATLPSVCSEGDGGSDFCDQTIGFFSDVACEPSFNEAQAGDLQEVTLYPFDYSLFYEDFGGFSAKHIVLPIVYATAEGRLGLYVEHLINNSGDYCEIDEVSYSAGVPTQMSVAHEEATGADYICASESSTGVGIYKLTMPRGPQTGATVTLAKNLGSATRGMGAACAQDKVAYLANAGAEGIGVRLMNWKTDTMIFSKDTTGITARGVALSANGLWMAYVDNGAIYIIDTSDGTELGVLIPPSASNVVKLEMDNAGNYVYFGADQLITMWNVVGTTNEEFVTFNPETQGGVTSLDDPSNPLNPECNVGPACAAAQGDDVGGDGKAGGNFGKAAEGLGSVFGGGPETGGMVLCAILIFAFLGIGLSVAPKGKAQGIGAAVGAVIGFVLCFVSELLSPLVVFCVVAVAAGVVYFRIFR